MMQVMQTISASPWVAGFKAVTCSNHACARWLTQRHLSSRRVGVTMDEHWYCCYGCVEDVVAARIARMLRTAPRVSTRASRMPLGLILMSRGLLTQEQVRVAMEQQKDTGEEIGETLLRLGYVDERQVTAARATQWGCPVFETFQRTMPEQVDVPLTLMRLYSMAPLHYVAATKSLLVGFVRRIEYGPLYAIEQVTGCRTQACFVAPSEFEQHLHAYEHGDRAVPEETKIESVETPAKMARVLCNYGGMLGADEVSIGKSMQYVWARLKKGSKANDFLFRV